MKFSWVHYIFSGLKNEPQYIPFCLGLPQFTLLLSILFVFLTYSHSLSSFCFFPKFSSSKNMQGFGTMEVGFYSSQLGKIMSFSQLEFVMLETLLLAGKSLACILLMVNFNFLPFFCWVIQLLIFNCFFFFCSTFFQLNFSICQGVQLIFFFLQNFLNMFLLYKC